MIQVPQILYNQILKSLVRSSLRPFVLGKAVESQLRGDTENDYNELNQGQLDGYYYNIITQ